jgi:DNA polymerase III epsilon subunit family exonuclease
MCSALGPQNHQGERRFMGHTIDIRACVVFDLETTGLNPSTDEIIEICAVRLNDNLEQIEEFYSLIKLDRALPEHITKLTGIDQAMLDTQGADRQSVMTRFHKFIGDQVLVGHYIDKFDIPFLRESLARYGLNISNRTLDTDTKCREFYKFPRYSLQSLADYLNIPCEAKFHNARSDVAVNIELFKRLLIADG